MAVTFHDQESGFLPQSRRKIGTWVKETIISEGFQPGDVAFVFCSPEYHLGINRQYLGHDYATDVITFDYGDTKGGTVSGDILIDPVTVRSQAARWESGPEQELMRVMIHGVLHLCGYKDKTTEEQMVMRSKENSCLECFTREYGSFPKF